MDIARLTALDQESSEQPGNAIHHFKAPKHPTSTTPHGFVDADGAVWWAKRSAQNGFVAELIAGRLAAKLEVGPLARPIVVPSQSLPKDGSAGHLEGLCVGMEHVNGINARDLGEFQTEGGTFDPGIIQPDGRAAVIVFQTWIGSAGDSQVIVDVVTGRVSSFDHGDTLMHPADVPQLVVTEIPGVSADVGKDPDPVMEMVARIEALTDDQILQAVAGVPEEPEWQSDRLRRLEIAQRLARRRDNLKGAMESWL